MRRLKGASIVAAVLFTTVLLVGAKREARADVTIVNCGEFTATPYASPSGKHGSTYQVSKANETMTCAQVTAYAKKLIAERGPAGSPAFTLTGGPSGYMCHAQGDASGVAYIGGCHKPSADFSGPAFSWRAQSD
jgi:hypothetical protein